MGKVTETSKFEPFIAKCTVIYCLALVWINPPTAKVWLVVKTKPYAAAYSTVYSVGLQ